MVNEITNNGMASAPSSEAKGKSALGKDDFMKLMMQQIKYQDPLNPMDGTAFSAQLAQFSQLEQLSNMNQSLTDNLNANYLLAQSINNTMAVTLIGKEIKLSGSNIKFNGESDVSLGYKLPAESRSVTVEIYDANGGLVKSYEEKNMASGDHKLSWDFTDNNGNKVQKGNYTFKVKAKDYNDADISVESYKLGTISSVKYTDSGAVLMVGTTQYNLSDILEILGTK